MQNKNETKDLTTVEEFILYLSILLLVATVALGIGKGMMILCNGLYNNIANELRVDMDEISYSQTQSLETFKVTVTDILKEKDKEDAYVLYLEHYDMDAAKNEDMNRTVTLSESEYNKLIGVDNNFITTDVYHTVVFSDEKVWNIIPLPAERIELYHFSALGETTIQENEIYLLKNLAQEVFNLQGKNKNLLYLDQIGTGKVQYKYGLQ